MNAKAAVPWGAFLTLPALLWLCWDAGLGDARAFMLRGQREDLERVLQVPDRYWSLAGGW